MSSLRASRSFGAVLTLAIVALTLATGYIHLTLGGLLFTLNGLGYLGLAALVVIGAWAPLSIIDRFSWFPRMALAGYTALTIAAYIAIGPHFQLGLITKLVEGALIALVLVDVIRVYGSPFGLVRAALRSIGPITTERPASHEVSRQAGARVGR